MPWYLEYRKPEPGESEATLRQRAGVQFYFPNEAMPNTMPLDFLARLKWADINKQTSDDCIIYLFDDGRDPRFVSHHLTKVQPTYRGMHPKKVVMLAEGEQASEMIESREIRKIPECPEKYCVNKTHLRWGNIIRNQHSK